MINGMIVGNKIIVAFNKKGSRLYQQTSVWYELFLKPPCLEHISKWYMRLQVKRGGNSPRFERDDIMHDLDELMEEVDKCVNRFKALKKRKKRTRSHLGKRGINMQESQLTLPTEGLSSSLPSISILDLGLSRDSPSMTSNLGKPLSESQPSFISNFKLKPKRFPALDARTVTPRHRSNSSPIRKEKSKRCSIDTIIQKPRSNSQPVFLRKEKSKRHFVELILEKNQFISQAKSIEKLRTNSQPIRKKKLKRHSADVMTLKPRAKSQPMYRMDEFHIFDFGQCAMDINKK